MIFLFLGIILLVVVLRDVFETVAVARGKISGLRSTPFLVRRIFWPPFRFVASLIGTPEWKAEILGLFAPFMLIIFLTYWLMFIIAAFGLISYSLASHYSPPIDSPLSAIYVSGLSVLTLGSSEFVTKTFAVRFIMLAGACCGVIVTASVVSLMFALIGALQRREILVALTSNVAGSPPSGLAILESYSRLNGKDDLERFFGDWYKWCADVFETQKAYPLLPYFRSTDAYTSWVTAHGAVLDAIALLLSVDSDAAGFSAKVTFQYSCKLLNELSQGWQLEWKESTTEVSDDEFRVIYSRLQTANYCVVDEVTARGNFERLRKEYAPMQRALCTYAAVPATPMITEYQLNPSVLAKL